MAVQTLKGFRDIPPELALKRGRALSLLKSVFKSYGFDPLETPTLEYASLLEGKYGGEAEKLFFKFKDRGGREVGMRYDLTVPLARFVAQNRGTLVFPFKRYQIGNVFRAEKPQALRWREFTQVDFDTLGADSALADAEILAVAASGLEILGVKEFTLLVNDRALFGKKKKEPTPRLKEIFSLLKNFGVEEKRFRFDPALERGLEYYTGMVFEVKVPGYETSFIGGGRYDELIGQLAGTKIPAVGGSFGLDRLLEIVPAETLAEVPFRPKLLVTVFSPELTAETVALFDKLQGAGVEAELYLDPSASLEKQLKFANRKGMRFALLYGPEEKRRGLVTLKDLKKGTQRLVGLSDLPKLIA